jgi:hypothetical protein
MEGWKTQKGDSPRYALMCSVILHQARHPQAPVALRESDSRCVLEGGTGIFFVFSNNKYFFHQQVLISSTSTFFINKYLFHQQVLISSTSTFFINKYLFHQQAHLDINYWLDVKKSHALCA